MNTSAALPIQVALIAALTLVPAVHGAASAQTETSITGTVMDETTFTPVGGATVVIAESGMEVRTDQRGQFIFPQVPAGRFTLRVSQPGFSTAVDQIDVAEGEVGFLQIFLLPLATVLDEVLVMTGRDPADRSTVVTGEDRRGTAVTAADLLIREVPGLSSGRNGGVGNGTTLVIRGIKSFTGNNMPAIYLDGVRISQNSSSMPPNDAPKIAILDDMPASQVKRIRVLKGASAAARFADSVNGVILIETVQGDQE